jgi:hypothetical protein
MTDLTPKMHIPTAETELALPYGVQEMVQNVGGLSIFSNAFRRGAGNKIFGNDENGIWLGAADYPSAPFRVDYDGHLIASSADLTASGYTKIAIFKQDSIPTSVSIGDLWFDTDDANKLYRAGSAGADAITSGEWELVRDTDIDQALSDASNASSAASTAQEAADNAQNTADSKINVFAQDTVPTSLAVGDLWYDTNDENKPYRAASVGADQITSGEWELVNDLRAADALLKAGSSQVLTGDIQVGGSNVKIDGDNANIIINDGSYDRILIGYQSGGF